MPPLSPPASSELTVDPEILRRASRHTADCADEIRAYATAAATDRDLATLAAQWGPLGQPVIEALRAAISHHENTALALAESFESTAATMANHAESYASTDAHTAAQFSATRWNA